MKLLLDGKQRIIYFRKDNTVYYKIKNKEYEVSKEVLKKNKKLIKGGVKYNFGSDELLKDLVIAQKDDKVWDELFIRNVYKKLLYVFILCKIEIENKGRLHTKITKTQYTKDIINKILRIVLGKTYDLDINKSIKILPPISLSLSEADNFAMYNDDFLKKTIQDITYKQITDSIDMLDKFRSAQAINTAYDKVTNVAANTYNLDFLKHIMIKEGLFESEKVLLFDSIPININDTNLQIFQVKTFDDVYKYEKSIYNNNLYEDDEVLYENIANKTIDDETIEKAKETRADNAMTYLNKLESMKALINQYLTDVGKKTAEIEKIEKIKTDYFTTDASKFYLSVTYNKLIEYKLTDIEENIGAKLRTFISFREENIPTYIVTKDVENAKRKIVFDDIPYGDHSGIFENNRIRSDNLEKFDKMKPLLSKLTKEPLAILIFGYGYSGSGKTYTLFGNEKDEGITHLAIRYFLSTGSTIEMDKVYELYNDKYDFIKNMNNEDPYPNKKSIYVYTNPLDNLVNFDNNPKSVTEFRNYYSPTTTLQTPPRSIIKRVDIKNFKATYDKIMHSRKSAILADSKSQNSILNTSKQYRIMATANNRESSRSHLFISLKITKNLIVSYLTICDMGGRENPNDLLLDTKIYNILYNVADWKEKCSPNNDIVSFPHIISKDLKTMYTLDGNYTKFGEAADKFDSAYDAAKKLASDTEAMFVPPREQDIGIPEDKGYAAYRKIKPIIYEIKEHGIDNRNDKYPGLLQSFKSFYARPAIYELFGESTDYNILQGTLTKQQQTVLAKIAAKNKGNFQKRIPIPTALSNRDGGDPGESNASITGRAISLFDRTHGTIMRNFIHLFFKCVKQGFFINDTINQLLNKFSGEISYTPPPTKIIVNTFHKRNVCVLESLEEVNTADVKKNPNSTSDDKTRAERAKFNKYGWHINSLPDSCITSTVYDKATDVPKNKNHIISNNIGESTYFQYDPEKVVDASKNHDTTPDHCVCLSSILENFCPTGVTKKYVVIGCLRSTPDFKPDDIATLKFLRDVSVSNLTKHEEEAPAPAAAPAAAT